MIVTLGAQGSLIHANDKEYRIECVAPHQVADPTGCGDAYRGGLLYGLAQNMDWETTGRLASTMGSLKIAQLGPQNHRPSRDEIADVFFEAYRYRPW
jgi:adenosine kinase